MTGILRFCSVRHREDVLRRVLTITVGTYHVLIREMLCYVFESPLQGDALPLVGLMAYHDSSTPLHLAEERVEARVAPIVDDEHTMITWGF